MIITTEYKGTKWIDLDRPIKDDVRFLVDTYGIDNDTAHELLVPSLAPRVELRKNYIYLVLHFPAFKHSHTEKNQEVDIILMDNVIITSRFDHIDAIHKLEKDLKTESIIDKDEITNAAHFIFFRMLRELYSQVENELSYLRSWSGDTERKIYGDKEKEMVFSISDISRVLLDFKRTLSEHGEVLERLHRFGTERYGEYFDFHTDRVRSEYERLINILGNQKEIISELRETNNSLLEAKQNEVGKIITVLAFIAVPLSLILSIFQIETKNRPLIGGDYDFWILTGFIVLVGLIMFGFFKYKKWL